MQRSAALDLLRGIAVMLVLFRHSTWDHLLQKVGWIGVDLFFVLSGYLVAGLVFREYLINEKFDFKRFFIRRGLKIYPAFYFFLGVSLLINYFEHRISYQPEWILAEVFFLQSYLPHVWTHTWSVAVEEHFYLALTFCSAIWLTPKRKVNFRSLTAILISLMLFALCMRFLKCHPGNEMDEYSFFSTHLRMDGIVVGVFVAALKYFWPGWRGLLEFRWLFLTAAAGLIWPPFVWNGSSYFMATTGLTLMNLGFGCLLIFVLLFSEYGKRRSALSDIVVIPLAFVGIHSYSIYLWHLLVLQECQQIPVKDDLRNTIYIVLSVLIGYVFSLLIARPSLRLREKYFAVK
jgi:peptidoglycan/LPS O-acetylase OafA/YrhL